MTGRPEVLFPLFGELTGLKGIGAKTAQLMVQMGIEKPRDLLLTLPQGGIDRHRRASIREVVPPAVVTVEVTVGQHHAPAAKNRPYRVTVTDAETTFQLIFFHARGDYLQKLLPTGQRRIVSGRIELFDGPDQTQVTLLDEIQQREPALDITPRDIDHEAKVGLDHALTAGDTAASRRPGQGDFLFRRQQPRTTDLAQVDARCVCRLARLALDSALA